MNLNERIAEAAYTTQHDVDSWDDDYEQPSIDYGLHRVKDKVFFWRARRAIAIGAKVPPFSGRLWGGDPHRTWMEKRWDEVRKKVAPSAPPRIGSVMVCPVLGKGFCSAASKWDKGPKHVYAVKVTGKVFTGNAEMWTEAASKTGPYAGFRTGNPKTWTPTERDENELEGWAREFWKGRAGYDFIESLVDGQVTVIARVDPKTGNVIEAREEAPMHLAERITMALTERTWYAEFGEDGDWDWDSDITGPNIKAALRNYAKSQGWKRARIEWDGTEDEGQVYSISVPGGERYQVMVHEES